MKLNGKPVKPPSPVVVTIYRENEEGQPENLKFFCGAILDYSKFESVCPQPKPPVVMRVKGGTEIDDKDKRYQAKLDTWSERRVQWMIISSLNFTPGLEWETVDLNKPDTWPNYEDELKTFLTSREHDRIVGGVIEANSPSENRRTEAIENFTSTPVDQSLEDSISQAVEHITTPSGEPVNDSASDLQTSSQIGTTTTGGHKS